MADKRLDQVTKVTDMAYVPVIMADGSIGQIAKADLASVVAGLMGSPICYKCTITDFNNGVSSGYYDVRGNVQNGPVSSFYGILLVIQGGSEIVQITSTNSNNLYLRTSTNSGSSWASWSALN